MNKFNNHTNLEPGYYYLAFRISFHSTVKPRLTTTPPNRPPRYSGQFFWSRNEASVIPYIKTNHGHLLEFLLLECQNTYSI